MASFANYNALTLYWLELVYNLITVHSVYSTSQSLLQGYKKMSVKRMVDYHIQRLNNKRDDIRLQAIQELIHLEAVEALAELENVYRNDPNDSIRRAAKNAGKTLFAHQLLTSQKESS